MKQLLPVIGVSCVLVLGACSKDEPAAGSGAATAKVDDKKASACPAGAWKEPSGLFCINAPGFKAGEVETRADDPEDPEMRVYFKKPQDSGKPELIFQLRWYPKRAPELSLGIAPNMESDYTNNKGEDKGEFASGKGKFFLWSRKDEPKSHKLRSVVLSSKRGYVCEADSFEAPIAPDVIAACKSLTPTD